MTERKRKPVIKPKPLPVAVDEMCWRSRIVGEFMEGYTDVLSEHANEAVRRMVDSIAVYEVSKDYEKEKQS